MRNILKRIIKGSPLEFPLRRLHRRLMSNFDENTRYDFETVQVMKRVLSEHSNCIDIGCHTGLFLAEMLRLAPQGVHFAFEPLPDLSQHLESRFPKAKVFNMALADVEGEATFHDIVGRRGASSLRVQKFTQSHEIRDISVKTDRLDNIIPSNIPIDLVKIDVEGAELLVLKGAVETFRKNKPTVIFEHGVDVIGGSPEEVYDLVTSDFGLRIYLMEHWLRNGDSLSRTDFLKEVNEHTNWYFMGHQ